MKTELTITQRLGGALAFSIPGSIGFAFCVYMICTLLSDQVLKTDIFPLFIFFFLVQFPVFFIFLRRVEARE